MYADDIHIPYADANSFSTQSNLNYDLEVSKWLICNKLTLNTTRTEFMFIGSRQNLSTLSESVELSIDNIPVKHISITKSLGILNEDLKWHSHIDKLTQKIASAIGAIKRIRPFSTSYTTLNLQYPGTTISIIVARSEEIVVKRYQISYKNCKIAMTNASKTNENLTQVSEPNHAFCHFSVALQYALALYFQVENANEFIHFDWLKDRGNLLVIE